MGDIPVSLLSAQGGIEVGFWPLWGKRAAERSGAMNHILRTVVGPGGTLVQNCKLASPASSRHFETPIISSFLGRGWVASKQGKGSEHLSSYWIENVVRRGAGYHLKSSTWQEISLVVSTPPTGSGRLGARRCAFSGMVLPLPQNTEGSTSVGSAPRQWGWEVNYGNCGRGICAWWFY